MKKTITKLFLVGLLGLSGLNAKELFDLRVQDFSYTLKNQQKNARYKVNDNIIIETNTLKASRGGYYYTDESNIKGLFNIELSNSILNWMYNYSIQYQKGTRLLKFISDSGQSIIFEFNNEKFSINGTEYKSKIEDAQLNLSISKINNSLKIIINGNSINRKIHNFGKLQKIETDLIYYDAYNWDKLYGSILVSND